jgi:hypothetical protein
MPMLRGVHCSFIYLVHTAQSWSLARSEAEMSKRQAVLHKRNIKVLSPNHFCRGKAVSITFSECASVALVIQQAKRMRRIILSSVARLALPYFDSVS